MVRFQKAVGRKTGREMELGTADEISGANPAAIEREGIVAYCADRDIRLAATRQSATAEARECFPESNRGPARGPDGEDGKWASPGFYDSAAASPAR